MKSSLRADAFVAGTPRVWARRDAQVPLAGTPFDVHPDGKRAAMFPDETATAKPESGSVHVTMLLNFADELRRRAPVGK